MRYVFFLFVTLFTFSAFAAELEQDSVKIVLKTSPGAEIGVDGVMSSTNRISLLVACGEHEAVVTYGASYSKTFTFTASLEENEFYFPIEGDLNIVTYPDEATVYVDGIVKGKTPLVIKAVGPHSVKVVKDPNIWYNETTDVDVAPFAHEKLEYRLRKLPPRMSYFINGGITLNNGAATFMLGMCRRWGWQVRGTIKSEIVSDDFTELPEGASLNVGKRKLEDDDALTIITTGPMLRFSPWLYVYAGAGYGTYRYGYDFFDLEYGSQDGEIHYGMGVSGIAVDAGVVLKWKALSISCGYTGIVPTALRSPVDARFGDVYLSLGFVLSGKNKNK